MRFVILGALSLFIGASGEQAPAPAGQPPAQPAVRRALPQVTQDYISIDAPVIALQHVRVIDGTGAPAVDDQTLVIEGTDIKAIGPSASMPVRTGARVMDLTGRSVMPGWVAMAIVQDELDLSPPGGPGYKPLVWRARGELTAALDDAAAKARAALAGTTDEHLATNWRLLVAGNVVLEDPRYMVIAETFTHLAHHRGQLTVYLRLNGAPVPAIYGPSADEKSFG